MEYSPGAELHLDSALYSMDDRLDILCRTAAAAHGYLEPKPVYAPQERRR